MKISMIRSIDQYDTGAIFSTGTWRRFRFEKTTDYSLLNNSLQNQKRQSSLRWPAWAAKSNLDLAISHRTFSRAASHQPTRAILPLPLVDEHDLLLLVLWQKTINVFPDLDDAG
jgi:hypothetical protein